MRAIVVALLSLMLTGAPQAEPMGATKVPVIVIDRLGGSHLTINEIVLSPGELVVVCFAKPEQKSAYCYILQPDGELSTGLRKLLAVPA